MDAPPRLADLDPDLLALRTRWLGLPRGEQDAMYAAEFAPRFAPLFAGLPLHGAPPDLERPEALISVLGLSWQPVALMAAWARPARMLVLGTKESFAPGPGDEGVLSLIARISGVPRDSIDHRVIGDPGEADIYREVRDFLGACGLPPRRVFVDPTGGKKSMSAAAALAGFYACAPLVYVDYGAYHHRIPLAGSEYPRLLVNPLTEYGDLERRDIFAAFDRGDFHEAEVLAARLADRLYQPREAQCLALLARGYGAWDRFEFSTARAALDDAQGAIARHARAGGWAWAEALRPTLAANLEGLAPLAAGAEAEHPASFRDGLPILAWYLAAAERQLGVGRTSLAVLLTYAVVERYVDLSLWTLFGLDDERPDYTLVAGRLDLTRYHAMGKRFFGHDYRAREVEGPLMFGNGAQLLAALAPERLAEADFGPLRGLSTARNRCEFEHGLRPKPPEREAVARFLALARAVVGRAPEAAGLDAMIDRVRFPVLGEVR
ncbi:MAG: hypothetical protein ABIO70_13785 [Pseudomonadota bacterium]